MPARNDFFSVKTRIKPSATVTINSLARQKEQCGERVFNLSAGEPILDDTTRYLKGTVDFAMKTNQTFYPPVAGIDELRLHATQWMNDLYKTRYKKQNTLITCGGKFGIYLLLQALLNEGDEAIIIAPYWVSYPSMVKLFGGKPVIINTEEKNGWKVSPEAIKHASGPRTKLIIINNASNPTGVLYSKKELKNILKIASRKNLIVLSDEVYSGLIYDDKQYISCASFRQFEERVVIIQSCSKNFGMTGWRVGFVFGSEEIINMLIKIQGQSITGTSSISQWAAIAALQNAEKITSHICKIMRQRRDLFVNTFNKLFKSKIRAPQSAFYSFIPLTAFGTIEKDSVKFCKKALKGANVAMVPGKAFGKEGYVRCSFGAKPKEFTAGLLALAKLLK